MSTGSESTPPPEKAAALSADDLITLNEEIAGMAKAGLPLDQGLAALARDMGRGRLRDVTAQLAVDLRAGHSLSDAIARQDGRVPPYYAALLKAGVRSGRLGDVLGTLTLYARAAADFRADVLSAMIYPTIVFVLGIGLIVFAGMFVLPTYERIYADFKMKLPLVTELLFYVGRHAFEFLLLPPVVLLVVLSAVRWWLNSTPRGRVLWARFIYSIPGFGSMVRVARLSTFAELLGILVDQKIPLPEALRLAAETSPDPLLHEGALQIESDLRQGVPFGIALREQRLVPELVVWLIGFGEKQGSLGASLRQVGQMYRRQAEVRAAFLRTIVPPLFIILIAGTIGSLFVFGLIGPLFELLDGLSGGNRK